MKDKTFGESSASPRAAGFLLSQTLVLNIPHHTLGFTLFPEQGRRVCGVCAPAYLSLFFCCARMRCWAQTLSSLPLFSSPHSLLVLILLRGESCVCICLCCCTKETHCVLRVGFWLNKCELSLVQQGSAGAGHSSNLEAAPGLPASLPAPADPASPCRSNGTLLAGLEKFVSGIQPGFVGFSPPPSFCSHDFNVG